MVRKFVVFDIETLSNCSTFCFLDYESKQKKSFVLWDRGNTDGLVSLYKFLLALKKNSYFLVGFNSLNFDSQILELILERTEDWIEYSTPMSEITSQIYGKAQEIIGFSDEEKFKKLIPPWKLSLQHIDLFKQKHYDRMQKAASLKWLQFTMRYHTVKEMPVPHDVVVTEKMIPIILEYNWDDVESTAFFFEKIMFESDTRFLLSEKYGLNLINASEPKMVREIFGTLLSADMDIPYSELRKMQTPRREVVINDIIFPYVKFETKACNYVKEWFQSLVVNPNEETKGIEKVFQFMQCEVVVALGGIHGCIKPGRYKTSSTHMIRDVDVVSFYPKLAIENNIKPQHLGDSFCKIYNDIFIQRRSIPKADPINYIFKIILNSCYGLSKEKNGYLYDPLFTYSITVNGQLTILMLAERLMLEIPDIVFYQMNTDGLSVGYDPMYDEAVLKICDEFCKITKQELEHALYKEMVIRDVNNYIGIYEDEKKEPKKKGIFETNYNWYGKQAVEYHKNPSFNVIPLAVEAYFVKGQDYKTFIQNHEDIFDFLGAVKKKHNFELVLYSLDGHRIKRDLQQKVTRFYVAEKGRKFYKEFTDRKAAYQQLILKDWEVEEANVITDKKVEKIRNNINYNFYNREVEKIITEIEGQGSQLTLTFE